MRSICVLLTAAALSGCMMAPQPTDRAAAEAELQRLIEGKVAGVPVSCVSSLRSSDMVVIDNDRVAFRENRDRVYVNDFRGQGCSGLGSGFYALKTRSFTAGRLCSGDLAEVVDTRSGMMIGSCVFGEFTPYTRPAG